MPPPAPSTPTLASFSDSPPVGDSTTIYHNVTLQGTAVPSAPIQIYNGTSGIGGALTDTFGDWSASTTPLSDDIYNIKAAAFDSAGNKSVLSSALTLTILSSTSTPSPTPTLTLNPIWQRHSDRNSDRYARPHAVL